MNVNIKRLSDDTQMPSYAHDGDAGFDLVSIVDVMVEPGETVKVPTGLAFEIPEGYELQVRPRSGITSKTKLRVQLGTVDASYRGEVSVVVDNLALPSFYINESYMTIGLEFNHSPLGIDGKRDGTINGEQEHTYIIHKGDRIAQAVIAPVVQATFIEVVELGETSRGVAGFGSTGTK